MRNRNSHKGDRSGKRRHRGGEDAREHDQRRAERAQVDAHVLRVHLAQLVGPDGLREEKGQHQRRAADQHHGPHVLPAHAGERAERPVVQVHDVGIVRKRDEKIRQRRADIPDHHAADDEQAHPLDLLRDGEHEAHREHRAQKRGQNEPPGGRDDPAAEQHDHRDRDRQLCARGNAEHEGACDGIVEKRLQQISRHRQRAAQQHRRQDPRQADVEQDPALVEIPAAEKDLFYFRRGQPDAARRNIPNQKNDQKQKEQHKTAPYPCRSALFHAAPPVVM